MSDFISKIEIPDILIFLGLASIGAGLFFWFGIGEALTTVGALLFLMGALDGFYIKGKR